MPAAAAAAAALSEVELGDNISVANLDTKIRGTATGGRSSGFSVGRGTVRDHKAWIAPSEPAPFATFRDLSNYLRRIRCAGCGGPMPSSFGHASRLLCTLLCNACEPQFSVLAGSNILIELSKQVPGDFNPKNKRQAPLIRPVLAAMRHVSMPTAGGVVMKFFLTEEVLRGLTAIVKKPYWNQEVDKLLQRVLTPEEGEAAAAPATAATATTAAAAAATDAADAGAGES